MAGNDTLIPSSTQEITPDWVKQVTGHAVIPDDFHIEGDIQAGIGFMSSICRVSYTTKDGNKHSIIVKLPPAADSSFAEYTVTDCADEREIKFYSVILPDLLKVVPELQENVCKYYNGGVKQADKSKGTERTSMLIVEDLKVTGFEMMKFSGEQDDRHIDGMITFLARLHFGSLAVVAEKGSSLSKLYPFIQGISEKEQGAEQFVAMCERGYPMLETFLESQNISKEIWKRYEKLRPYTRAIIEKVEKSGKQNPCLIHGDVWPPNIFVHPAGLPVKILDWQLVACRDATFDIIVMLYTVLPQERLTRENVGKLVRRYYLEFEQLCQDKGYGEKIKRRSWEEFEQFTFTWGMAFGYLMCLPSIECYDKDMGKYANLFRVLCEEYNIPEFLLKECSS